MSVRIKSNEVYQWFQALNLASQSVSYDWEATNAIGQIERGVLDRDLFQVLIHFKQMVEKGGVEYQSRDLCSYFPMAGLHYQKIRRFHSPTEKEIRLARCTESGRENLDYWPTIMAHGAANAAVFSPQFSRCFMERLVAVSTTLGREIAIVYSAVHDGFTIQIGEEGRFSGEVTKNLAVLHTHPRATDKSLPLITHSKNDLLGAVLFAISQKTEILHSVTGRICGGPLQTSVVAISGHQVYVMNDYEERWIQSIAEEIRQQYGEELRSRGLPRPLSVQVNPQEIKRITQRQRIDPEVEQQLLAGLEKTALTN